MKEVKEKQSAPVDGGNKDAGVANGKEEN